MSCSLTFPLFGLRVVTSTFLGHHARLELNCPLRLMVSAAAQAQRASKRGRPEHLRGTLPQRVLITDSHPNVIKDYRDGFLSCHCLKKRH